MSEARTARNLIAVLMTDGGLQLEWGEAYVV